MRPRPHRRPIVTALVAAVALAGCAALDGDAPPSAAAGGVFGGDVAASAYDGEVVVTADELEEVLELLLGEDDLVLAAGEQGIEQLLPIQRQVLEYLVEQAVFAEAAEEQFGITVTQDDVEQSLEEAAEEAGGMDALAARLEEQGSSLEIERDVNRPVVVRYQRLVEALGEGGADDAATLVGQWEQEQLREADVLVSRRFGAWDPAGLTIVPAEQAEA